MSLYVCDACNCIENTALARYWLRNEELNGQKLCSKCDPAILNWHGRFPREVFDPKKWELKGDFVYGKE